MARFRNDFGEGRVVPTLGYVLVEAGDAVTVPDEEWHHWEAGGWTALDPDPRPDPEAEPAAAAALVPAPAPISAPSAPVVPAAAAASVPADSEVER